MNTHNAAQRIVVILLIVGGSAGSSFPVFADSVHIYGGNFNLSIPANPGDTKGWMDDAVIEVLDHHVICDLDVAISLTHTCVFDLKIFLEGPDGTNLCLNMYNVDEYFEGENYTQTIFDDEAEVVITQAEPPFTGRFRPVEPYELSEFNGQPFYGLWRLKIYDAYCCDIGTLNSFQLMMTTPEPATAALLILGTCLLIFFRPHQNR